MPGIILLFHIVFVEKNKKEAMEVKPKSADMDVIEEKEEKFLSAIPVDDSFLGDMDLQKDAEVCKYCFRKLKTFFLRSFRFMSKQWHQKYPHPFHFFPIFKMPVKII